MVYIPHCGTSLVNMFEHVQEAMLVAFGGSSAEDAAMRERILQCDTPGSLIKLVKLLQCPLNRAYSCSISSIPCKVGTIRLNQRIGPRFENSLKRLADSRFLMASLS